MIVLKSSILVAFGRTEHDQNKFPSLLPEDGQALILGQPASVRDHYLSGVFLPMRRSQVLPLLHFAVAPGRVSRARCLRAVEVFQVLLTLKSAVAVSHPLE